VLQSFFVLLVELICSLLPVAASSAIYLRLIWFKKHRFANRVTHTEHAQSAERSVQNLEEELEQQVL
jgi:hypothetical protein